MAVGARRIGPFRIATFFGGKHATINMALWRRDVADTFTAADMRGVLAQIAAGRRSRFPAAVQSALPLGSDAANPFCAAASIVDRRQFRAAARRHERRNPRARALRLDAQPPAQQGKASLQKLKDYRYLRAKTAHEVDCQLASFLHAEGRTSSQRSACTNAFARIPASKISFGPPVTKALKRGKPVIELHALECDGDMLALFSGHPRQSALHLEVQFAYRLATMRAIAQD